MKKEIFILIALFFSFFASTAIAIDERTPSLKIVYQRDREAIVPGEIIKFDVYFPGDGNINLCRCSVYYNGKNYDKMIYSTAGAENKSFNMLGTVTSFLIPNDIFLKSQNVDWSPTQAEMGGRIEGSGPVIPPLRLWLDTKSSIPEGDNYITLFLSYTDGDVWYTYEKNLEFHVKTWSESNELLIIIGADIILPIILTIFGAFLGFLFAMNIYNRPRIKIKPKINVERKKDNIIVKVTGSIKNKGNMELKDLQGTIFVTLGGTISGPQDITFLPEVKNQITLFPKSKREFIANQNFIKRDIPNNVTHGKVKIEFKNDIFRQTLEKKFKV